MEEIEHQFIASDGTAIHYVDIGRGKPLLFVHGFGGSSAVQMPIFERLKAHFRCLCFDQRGYGKTEGRGDIGLPRSARDAEELLTRLGIDDAIFLGYSMGAGVLFSYVEQFGCRHLERVIIGEMSPKLINDDSWHFGLYQGWYTEAQFQRDLEIMERHYSDFNTYFAAQTFFPHTPEDPRDFHTQGIDLEALYRQAGDARPTLEALLSVSPTQERSNRAYWRSMGEGDYRDTLARITVPAAIFYADPGSLYDPRAAMYMAARLPGARLCRYEHCTHMAKNEKLDQFIADIQAFAYPT